MKQIFFSFPQKFSETFQKILSMKKLIYLFVGNQNIFYARWARKCIEAKGEIMFTFSQTKYQGLKKMIIIFQVSNRISNRFYKRIIIIINSNKIACPCYFPKFMKCLIIRLLNKTAGPRSLSPNFISLKFTIK